MSLLSLAVLTLFGAASSNNCPDEWIHFGSSCYHFSHDTESMPVAALVCEHLEGHLVEIESAQENTYLASKAAALKGTFWIGLNDIQQESVWVWYDSIRHLTSTQFQHWSPNEPNNAGMDENCAYMLLGGKWNDAPCHMALHYICEKEEGSAEIIG